MPFGISSAPEVFQKYVLEIFEEIEGVQVVFDDIIITGENETEHDKILTTVLETTQKNNINFNKEKIQLKVKSVKYFGFNISENGLSPDSDKVRATVEMETGQCKEEVKQFFGMANYLSSFIPNLAQVNVPLRELVKNDVA